MTFGVMSDLHFHDWSQFSSVGADGVNSRLDHIIEAFGDACETLRHRGGTDMFIAGDVFHVRGSLKPSVMNPVIKAFKEWNGHINFHVIPGNHDLETNDTTVLGNSLGALAGLANVIVYNKSRVNNDVVMIPWHKDLNELMEELKRFADPERTAIIHAPLNDVIAHIPDNGLSANQLQELGYKRVFVGHYHNAKEFDGDIMSAGALTHQTFSDINSKAGYWIVDGDNHTHLETLAPKFVSLPSEDKPSPKGNFVRVKSEVSLKESEIKELREEIMSAGALGCVMQITPKIEVIRTTGASASHERIESTIDQWRKDKGMSDEVLVEALDVLQESEVA